MVGGQELERDLQVDLLARLDRHHHLALEDLHRRRLPFGRLDAPECLAVLLEALEHRREPADTGLEDHGGHGREAIEHPARHHVVERVHHVHGEAEAGRGHDVGQLVALRRPVLVPHGERMEAELHARVDDRLPERVERAVRVLPPEHRIGADEHRREAALGDPVHLGDRGLDVDRGQGRDRDEAAARAAAVVVEDPVVVDGAHRRREVRQERAAGQHEGRVEDGARHAVLGIEGDLLDPTAVGLLSAPSRKAPG